MAKVFTQHVRDIEASNATDPAILREIEDVLRSELRRRGILGYGPSLLGYLGNSWGEPDAMGDLVHDCYIRAIATRLPGLRRNLEKSGDIERLIRRNIRTFVGERQSALDPIGYAIYQNSKAAVLELADLGILTRVESTNTRVTATCEFEFVSNPAGTAAADDTALEGALRATPALIEGIESLTRIGGQAQELLAISVRNLPDHAVVRFTIGALKRSLSTLLDQAAYSARPGRELSISSLEKKISEDFRTAPAGTGYEKEEDLAKLADGILEGIAALRRSEAVKTRMRNLLEHLVEAARHDDGEDRETLDDLAERFGVSRSTVHDDFQSLRAVVQKYAEGTAAPDDGEQHG